MSTSHIVSAPVVTPISSSQVNLSQELPEKYLSLHGYGDSTGWVPVRKIVCIVDAKLHAMGAFRPEDFTKDPRIVSLEYHDPATLRTLAQFFTLAADTLDTLRS